MNDTLGRAAFVVLGCAKNQVEAESMTSRLAQMGWEITADIPNASVIIVHTCGFLEAARQEALDTVAGLRKAAPRSFLVMTGCYAQYVNGKSVPGVDALLGTGEFHRLPEVMARRVKKARQLPPTMEISPSAQPVVSLSSAQKTDRAPSSPSGYHDALRPRPIRRDQLSAYLRLSEGCNHRCSFCIIPQLRGNLKSREPEDIFAEARDLTSRGIRELAMISQDTTDYGRDLSPRRGLTDLLRELVTWDDVRWLRLLYSYPSEVDDSLISLLAREEKLCGYLDMPLQHISDRILKSMKRDWGRRETMRLLENLKKRVPHLALRTTFIVGFPGETEDDFDQMLELTETGIFEHMGAFPYSLETRSPSFHLDERVSPNLIQERWDRLMEAQAQVIRKRSTERIGREIEVLAETDPMDRWLIRASYQAPEVDGGVLLDSPPAVPGFYRARITGFHGADIRAELLQENIPARRQKMKSRAARS